MGKAYLKSHGIIIHYLNVLRVSKHTRVGIILCKGRRLDRGRCNPGIVVTESTDERAIGFTELCVGFAAGFLFLVSHLHVPRRLCVCLMVICCIRQTGVYRDDAMYSIHMLLKAICINQQSTY